jgi:hypothetical protein
MDRGEKMLKAKDPETPIPTEFKPPWSFDSSIREIDISRRTDEEKPCHRVQLYQQKWCLREWREQKIGLDTVRTVQEKNCRPDIQQKGDCEKGDRCEKRNQAFHFSNGRFK